MKKLRLKPRLLSILLISFFGLACAEDLEDTADFTPKEAFSISNNVSALSRRVAQINEVIGIVETQEVSSQANIEGSGTKSFISPKFTLKAEVVTPENNNADLSATEIVIIDNYALVTYHVRGAAYGGALEVLDISDKDNILILSQILFEDTDINSVAIDDLDRREGSSFDIYLAGADTNGALVKKFSFASGRIMNSSHQSLKLPGVNANGALQKLNYLYVTVGGTNNNGGLFEINLRDFTLNNQFNFSNAKDIDYHFIQNKHILYVLTAGSQATVKMYTTTEEGGMRDYFTHTTIGSINTLDGKNGLCFAGRYMYVSLGENGVSVYNKVGIRSGALFNASQDDLGGAGLANAVAADSDHVYIANGSSGVYIADIPSNSTGFVVNGALNMDGSANYVAATEDIILVANGIGGVKVLDRRDSEVELNLQELEILYDGFRYNPAYGWYEGAILGGQNMEEFEDLEEGRKNQFQIPISDLSSLSSISFKTIAHWDYRLEIYLASEAGEYSQKLTEFDIPRLYHNLPGSIEGLDISGYEYLIFRAVPSREGWAQQRFYIHSIEIKGTA